MRLTVDWDRDVTMFTVDRSDAELVVAALELCPGLLADLEPVYGFYCFEVHGDVIETINDIAEVTHGDMTVESWGDKPQWVESLIRLGRVIGGAS